LLLSRNTFAVILYARLCIGTLLLLLSGHSHAGFEVTDDSGDLIKLAQPAKRIISLAPNLTELLFAAGAGTKIVGTVRHSDYPAAASQIPLIGDSFNLDIEAIISLQPDLILLWQSGTGEPAWRKLKALGLTVYRSEPDTLEKIASSIERFGQLADTTAIANSQSRELRAQIAQLGEVYTQKPVIRVFYQFWDKPIYTVNGQHLISHIIELCGGQNIYADLGTLTPRINPESVLERNPEVIIASGVDETPPAWLDYWKQWPELTATQRDQIYYIPPDYLQRHTPRVMNGATRVCEYIDRARQTSR
jgi:iron complex transport system substrate-binding protein